MRQQIVTFEELFPHVKEDGIYLCEDLHTSYVASYGGGLKRCGTFIEYSKNFIDYLNARSATGSSGQMRMNDFSRTVDAIHYYDSVLVIEKAYRDFLPSVEQTGHISLPATPEPSAYRRRMRRIRNFIYLHINLLLRRFRIKGFTWY
jgi:hypothetical protein